MVEAGPLGIDVPQALLAEAHLVTREIMAEFFGRAVAANLPEDGRLSMERLRLEEERQLTSGRALAGFLPKRDLRDERARREPEQMPGLDHPRAVRDTPEAFRKAQMFVGPNAVRDLKHAQHVLVKPLPMSDEAAPDVRGDCSVELKAMPRENGLEHQMEMQAL